MHASSDVHVEREAKVGRPDALREAVRAEEVGTLVGDHRDLQVGAALLVRRRQVDVRVGRPVCAAQVPLVALPTGVLRLQRLHLLLLHLEIGEGGLHLAGRRQLSLLCLLLLDEDRLHRADEAGTLELEAPSGLSRHARARLTNEGRLRCRQRLGGITIAHHTLLELLHRRIFDKNDLLREHGLKARHERRPQLLSTAGVDGRHLCVTLGHFSLELVDSVADQLVCLGTERRHRLAARHALAQSRNVTHGIS
mmetsp:Transcript_37415/g.98975  ORF Transcript_37415/g.98975 Transcript_37415/m.98975 type:complete len:252 (+) Transcript_37415:419-1174(+)